MVLANDPRDERGPRGGGHRRSRAKQCDQQHDDHDGVHEDQRHRASHLDQSGANQQTSRVVGIHEAPHRAREEEERDHAGGEQHADLIRMGTVSLETEGQGDQGNLVAEGRDHPAGEGHDQIPASCLNVQHVLNSIC